MCRKWYALKTKLKVVCRPYIFTLKKLDYLRFEQLDYLRFEQIQLAKNMGSLLKMKVHRP